MTKYIEMREGIGQRLLTTTGKLGREEK